MKKYLLLTLVLASVSTSAWSTEQKAQVDSSDVENAILNRKDDFFACYNKHQKAHAKKKSGKVVTDFVIGADGKVSKASIKESTLKEPKVEACILETIQSIQFPVPHNGKPEQVSYPFQFSGEK
jgi:TonB family protein